MVRIRFSPAHSGRPASISRQMVTSPPEWLTKCLKNSFALVKASPTICSLRRLEDPWNLFSTTLFTEGIGSIPPFPPLPFPFLPPVVPVPPVQPTGSGMVSTCFLVAPDLPQAQASHYQAIAGFALASDKCNDFWFQGKCRHRQRFSPAKKGNRPRPQPLR